MNVHDMNVVCAGAAQDAHHHPEPQGQRLGARGPVPPHDPGAFLIYPPNDLIHRIYRAVHVCICDCLIG